MRFQKWGVDGKKEREKGEKFSVCFTTISEEIAFVHIQTRASSTRDDCGDS